MEEERRITALIVETFLVLTFKLKRKRKMWVRDWLRTRENVVTRAKILREFRRYLSIATLFLIG